VLSLDGVRDAVLARVKELHEKGGAVAAELKKLDKEEKRLLAEIERLSAAVESGDGALARSPPQVAEREQELVIVRARQREVEEQAGRKENLPSDAKLLEHLGAVKGQLFGDESRAAANAVGLPDVRNSGTPPKASASVARFHGWRRLAASGRPRRWPRDRVQTFPRCVVESRECLRSSCRDQEISVSSFSNSSGVQMIGLASPALSSTPKTLGRIRAFAICVQFHVTKESTW
jgi:hypothetical protein